MGKYKYGPPDAHIELAQLKKAMAKHILPLAYQCYVILLFWVGCRRSEPLAVTKDDVTLDDHYLLMDIPAYKHGKRAGPLEFPLSYWGVSRLRQLWESTPEGQRLFRFSDKTGYRIVKRLFPMKSPHWLRHNRITKLRERRDQGEISTDDIKSFTGIRSDKTLEHYGMKTTQGIRKVVKVLE